MFLEKYTYKSYPTQDEKLEILFPKPSPYYFSPPKNQEAREANFAKFRSRSAFLHSASFAPKHCGGAQSVFPHFCFSRSSVRSTELSKMESAGKRYSSTLKKVRANARITAPDRSTNKKQPRSRDCFL